MLNMVIQDINLQPKKIEKKIKIKIQAIAKMLNNLSKE